MAMDIADGLNYLHTQETPILHRDLKSLNLLVTQVPKPGGLITVKITDFGLSRDLLENTGHQSNRMTGMAGTFHWMAPEVLKSEHYTHKADVYSYGICLWEILCREPPFKTWKPHEIIQKVVQESARPEVTKLPRDVPQELVMVMRKCWEQHPQDRPDMSDVVRALRSIQDRF